jgi:DNA-binding CsgD family transcriptional regulator
MFTHDDAQWLSATVRGLYSASDTRELTLAGIEAVHRRFRLVASGCEEISNDHSRYVLHGARCETPPPADHAAYIHDNPAAPVLGKHPLPRTFQIRELVPFESWKRTDNYNGIARPMGYADQLSTVAPLANGFLLLSLFRDTPFASREVQLLTLLQPHLHATWQRMQPPPESSVSSAPSHLLLDARLVPVTLNDRQHLLLRRYFPHWRERTRLPPQLHDWVASSLSRINRVPVRRPLYAFSTASVHGHLLVRCFPSPDSDATTLYLVERPSMPNYLLLRRFGLTARECEVLHWIAQGKGDAQIGAIAGCAPKTVGKHVENVLRKLSAENRGAAVNIARQRLRFPGHFEPQAFAQEHERPTGT